MSASKAKNLISLLNSVFQRLSAAEDVALKQYVASNDTSSPSSLQAIAKCFVKSSKKDKHSSSRAHSDLAVESLNLESKPFHEDSMKQLSWAISSILRGDSYLDLVNSQATNGEKPFGRVLDIPWSSNLPNDKISVHRKKLSRERKQKWVYKKMQTNRFDRLVKMCGEKLGTDTTIQVLGKLGRETDLKKYNASTELPGVRVDDGDIIEELCNYIASDDGGDKSKLQDLGAENIS